MLGKHKMIKILFLGCALVMAGYREKPLDMKSPLDLLKKRRQSDMSDLMFGAESTFSLGYEEDYLHDTKAKGQWTNFDVKMLQLPTSWSAVYGRFFLDMYPYPQVSGTRSPYFSNALSNSRMAASNAYLLFGDLNKTPFYVYFGQLKTSYGQNFSPTNVTDLPGRLHALTQRVLSVGWFKECDVWNGNAEVFFFNGDARAQGTDSPNMALVGTSSWKFGEDLGLEVQGGWLSNLADTDGFQRTTGSIGGYEEEVEFDYDDASSPALARSGYSFSEFTGLASVPEFEKIRHRVPGVNVSWKATFPMITVASTFALALGRFDYRDLVQRDQGLPFVSLAPRSEEGIRPSAWGLYAIRDWQAWEMYGGYEQSREALPLAVPKNRRVLGVNYQANEFMKWSFEVRQDRNYDAGSYALGPAREIVSCQNPVHVDGLCSAPAYSYVQAAEPDMLGQTLTSAVLALKVKF